MLSNKFYVGIAAVIVFVAGSGYIVYAGRPIMKIEQPPSALQGQPVDSNEDAAEEEEADDEQENEDAPTPAVPAAPTGNATKGTYTMTDVQTHNTPSDCWSAIGGDVYDLTSWVSRHPGGEKKIIGLCGTDGTAAYSGKHGSSARPKAMLVLLKIGTLK